MSDSQKEQSPDKNKNPEPSKKELLQWKCEFPEDLGKGADLTVGTKTTLSCHGEFQDTLKEPLKIKFNSEKSDYAIYVLNTNSLENESISLEVALYKAGKFNNLPFEIHGMNGAIGVEPLSWTVASVLPPNQKTKPFPSMGPIQVGLPWWYWGLIAFAILIPVVLFFFQYRKYSQRKKILEELESHGSALGPYNQFNKDLRLLKRRLNLKETNEGGFVQEVDDMFRMYLVRELKVPAQHWSDKAISKEIKRKHRKIFRESGVLITKFFRELKKAKNPKEDLTQVDCEQLSMMGRKLVDKIYKTKRSLK